MRFCYYCSVAKSSSTLWPLWTPNSGFSVLHYLSELAPTHIHWVSDAIQPPHLLSPPSPPALNLSQHLFSNEIAIHIRWPKYWSFSLNISPSDEYSGLISFRIDWLDLLAVQGTLSFLQHHKSKASVLQPSAIFMIQLSHPYMAIGKIIALIIWTFVGKLMFLLFNMLSLS